MEVEGVWLAGRSRRNVPKTRVPYGSLFVAYTLTTTPAGQRKDGSGAARLALRFFSHEWTPDLPLGEHGICRHMLSLPFKVKSERQEREKWQQVADSVRGIFCREVLAVPLRFLHLSPLRTSRNFRHPLEGRNTEARILYERFQAEERSKVRQDRTA